MTAACGSIIFEWVTSFSPLTLICRLVRLGLLSDNCKMGEKKEERKRKKKEETEETETLHQRVNYWFDKDIIKFFSE